MSSLLYTFPITLYKEIDDLEVAINSYLAGTINEIEIKAKRVPFGVYEQRRKGMYMVRVRCAAGIITPLQLEKVAYLAKEYGSGSLHITTRQEIQIHDVVLESVISIIRELATVGLSSRGGGGNTVRNITASSDSGIDPNEFFDVAPHAVALTTFLINRPDSWLLPRKYKIAFSNSTQDTAFATVQDLGFVACVKNGLRGFRVFVAGGMGKAPQVGHILHDFIEENEIFSIAEAVKKLFSKYGNRKNKHAARIRFLWNSLGRDAFIRIYEEERTAIQSELSKYSNIENIENIIADSHFPPDVVIDSQENIDLWQKRFASFQKDQNALKIIVPLLNGIIDADSIIKITTVLKTLGENTIRFTSDQNIKLRNIPAAYNKYFYSILSSLSNLSKTYKLFSNAIACAGANTCQLGIARARDALNAVIDNLQSSSLNLDEIAELKIQLSGCPNMCGQHVVADLGFSGKVSRKNQHSYPAYIIWGGAILDGSGSTKLAEKIDEISAKDLPYFVNKFLKLYIDKKKNYKTFADYLQVEGKETIKKIVDIYRNIPSFDKNNEYYKDWGETEKFSLASKGTGECSSGLFDLIELDLKKLRELRNIIIESKIVDYSVVYGLALVSSRMLLITRAAEATSESEIFTFFKKHFIEEKLIDSKFLEIIDYGIEGKKELVVKLSDQVVLLSENVESLYESMDNSMQFKKNNLISDNQNVIKKGVEIVKIDLRGVACPMNFVKTKVALASMKKGELLEVLLDNGEPIENVPKSVVEEGHYIVKNDSQEDYTILIIRKN
jgi:sulfite reductase (ferredoxin)